MLGTYRNRKKSAREFHRRAPKIKIRNFEHGLKKPREHGWVGAGGGKREKKKETKIGVLTMHKGLIPDLGCVALCSPMLGKGRKRG